MKNKTYLIATLVALWLAFTSSGFAASHTWTGNGANGLWTTAANWENNNPPFANESPAALIFPATANRRTSTNNIGGMQVSAMAFDGVAYHLHGTGAGTNITLLSGGFFGAISVFSGSGHSIASSIQLTLTQTNVLGVAGGADLSIYGRLTGGGSFQKTGDGILLLRPQVNNTFSGMVHVRGGELALQGAVGSDRFITVPGALIIGETNNTINTPIVKLLANHQINNASPVSIYRNGKLNLNGNTEACGALNLFGGRVETIGNAGNGNLMPAGITAIPESASLDAGLVTGFLTLAAPATNFMTVETTNASLEIAAQIRGGNGGSLAHLTKLGSGRLLLSASNSFNGGALVREGRLCAHHNWALGTTNGATVVATNAVLQLWDSMIPNEPLILEAGATLESFFNESWAGPITLAGNAFLKVQDNGGEGDSLTLLGKISGPGGFTKTGLGVLNMKGSTANTYGGATVIQDGDVNLANGPGLDVPAIPGELRIGSHSMPTKRVTAQAPRQLNSNSVVWMQFRGALDLQNFHATTRRLIMDGGTVEGALLSRLNVEGPILCSNKYTLYSTVSANINLGTATTNVHVDSGDLILSGQLSGPAGAKCVKTGNGDLRLKGNSDFDGHWQINAGTVFADGVMPATSFTPFNNAKVSGTGQVETVTLQGGWLWLQRTPNPLRVAQLLCPSNGIIEFDASSAANFGQVICASAPQLGSNVNMFPLLLSGFSPPVGQEFTVIRNDSSMPASGTFIDKPEGILFEAGFNTHFRLTYQGGDGNDVVLKSVAPPEAASMQGVTTLGAGVQVKATGAPGAWYVIEATEDFNLSGGGWKVMQYLLCPANGIMEWKDNNAVNFPQRFYRFGAL